MMKLNKALRYSDKILLISTALLFVFGLLNIVSASSQTAVIKYNSTLYSYFYRQLITIVLGVVLGIFIIKTPTKSYSFFGVVFYLLILMLSLMVSFSSLGATYSGNNNWINIKGFTFQPSEFAKLAMIVCVSVLIDKYYTSLLSNKVSDNEKVTITVKILFAGALFPLIILLQRDLGTMIIISTIFVGLFLTSPIPMHLKMRAGMVCGILALFAFFFYSSKGSVLSNAQSSRLDFFNPCEKYEAGGYQICNGFIAINSGGLLGNGIGKSKQISYIPESHTDSVFAIIAEQYGLIVTTLIFIIFIIILKSILNIATSSKTIRGRYLCLGVAIYIFLHILINLGGLFGIMPLTGVPLPFLSYGGSFTITLICSLAVVQRVAIENAIKK